MHARRRVGWLPEAAGLFALVLAFGPARASGQELRGAIVDATTARPVVLAYIGLLAPGRQFVVAALADGEGRFSIRAPEPGAYFLYVARTGYRPVLDGLFELGEDGVLELSVGMTPAPIPVDPVVVEVERRGVDLAAVGFYDRRASGPGHFITREEIERSSVAELADAMRGVVGLRVYEPGVDPLFPTGVQHSELLVRRGGEWCSPTLFVDGVAVALGERGGGGPARPDDYVDPSEVNGVEIYTGAAETPPQFEGMGACGAVLIWTRKR